MNLFFWFVKWTTKLAVWALIIGTGVVIFNTYGPPACLVAFTTYFIARAMVAAVVTSNNATREAIETATRRQAAFEFERQNGFPR